MTEPRVRIMRRTLPPVCGVLSGRLVVDAEPDMPDHAPTVRIGDVGLWATLRDDYGRLTRPINALFTVDDGTNLRVLGTDDFHLSLGFIEDCCGDGCCGGVTPTTAYLGKGWHQRDPEKDLVQILAGYDRRHVVFGWTFRGHVDPLVTVTLAHLVTGYGRPGQEVTVPLREAKNLAHGHRLLAAHTEKVMKL